MVTAENQLDEVRTRMGRVLREVVQEMTAGASGVEVSFTTGDRTTIYRISVPQEHRGKLIGAQGKNITSLRNILGAMAGSYGFRAIIELVV
nr:hypothetical protein CKG001_26740 [Bdellovibrio sp. CKG001]BFD63982.1 hypothetical protein BdHM001_26630 [Bdellovibrio sp. HM001]